MVGVRAKVLGQMGWTTSPYLRASALSCPSLVVYRTGAFGLRPFTASIGPASLYRRSCVSPLAAGGAEEPLDLLLESPHRESEFGLFVARSVILRPTLFALLQLLAAFQPLVVVLDHHDSSPRAVLPIVPVAAFATASLCRGPMPYASPGRTRRPESRPPFVLAQEAVIPPRAWHPFAGGPSPIGRGRGSPYLAIRVMYRDRPELRVEGVLGSFGYCSAPPLLA